MCATQVLIDSVCIINSSSLKDWQIWDKEKQRIQKATAIDVEEIE